MSIDNDPPRLVASSSFVSTQLRGCAGAYRSTASSIAPACEAADTTSEVSNRSIAAASVASSSARRGSLWLLPAVTYNSKLLSSSSTCRCGSSSQPADEDDCSQR